MRVVRVFVSSPADALAERCRVGRVVDKLNAVFSDSVRLEDVRWEERFYSAHDGFQPQIPRSSECDIVVAILRGRLGSPLSAAFHVALPEEERLPGGGLYPSGTAYEILTAIRARQEKRRGDLPDIYVFRWSSPPQISLDAPERAEIEAQWTALKRFVDEVFFSPEGHFKGAHQKYASLDEFEAQVEALLRGWLNTHVFEGRAVVWPVETRGSPFRGLEPFGMKHADVFFGRAREVARGVAKLKAAAQAGLPFQVVVGPSGAGKSSFVRAGLVPKLTSPGEIEGVGVWRVALMRPSESLKGPVAVLARRLFDGPDDVPEAETGRPIALPELALGPFSTPEALARQLDHADETSAAPLLEALARVAEKERARWGTGRAEAARLLLIVDQLDEMFSVSISDEQRANFARLLEVLGRSGAVWMMMTLGAEFYEVFLKSPLATLAGDERTLTLKAPARFEMAEIVRAPAEAAALIWEIDPDTSERLDERLLADIDRPDLLPLLQFVLDRLYEKRESVSGQPLRLTFSAYHSLGTLDGAIHAEAERAFLALGVAEQAALPRLLRSLVTSARAAYGAAETSALTLNPARIDAVAPDAAAKRLVAALTSARILITMQGAEGAWVGLAHQRVIEAWGRAKAILDDGALLRRVRDRVADRRREWEGAKRPNALLLPRLLLSHAEELVAHYQDEISPEDFAYISSSRRYAGRALRRAYILSGLFASVALAAVMSGFFAYQQQQRAEAGQRSAERNFAIARNTTDRVIFDIAQGLRDIEGINTNTITKILENIEMALDLLSMENFEMDTTQHSKAIMLGLFGDAYLSSGDRALAIKAYEGAIKIARSLQQKYSSNMERRRDLTVLLNKLGDLKSGNGQHKEAVLLYEQVLDIRNMIYKDDKQNDRLLRDIALTLDRIGIAKEKSGDQKGANIAFAESVEILRQLANKNKGAVALRDLSVALDRVGSMRLGNEDNLGALAAFKEGLSIRRSLSHQYPEKLQYKFDVSESLEHIGDTIDVIKNNEDSPLRYYEESLDIGRQLIKSDPNNVFWATSVIVSIYKLSELTAESHKKRALLTEAIKMIEPLESTGKLSGDQLEWPDLLRKALKNLEH